MFGTVLRKAAPASPSGLNGPVPGYSLANSFGSSDLKRAISSSKTVCCSGVNPIRSISKMLPDPFICVCERFSSASVAASKVCAAFICWSVCFVISSSTESPEPPNVPNVFLASSSYLV